MAKSLKSIEKNTNPEGEQQSASAIPAYLRGKKNRDMRYGTVFWLRRGSISRTDGMGKARFVLARLLFSRGNQVYAELLENDRDTYYPEQKGFKGWWSISSVFEFAEKRPIANAENYVNRRTNEPRH